MRSVIVNLIVKAENDAAAQAHVAQRLNAWLLETPEPPFPSGALLCWNYWEKPIDATDEEPTIYDLTEYEGALK